MKNKTLFRLIAIILSVICVATAACKKEQQALNEKPALMTMDDNGMVTTPYGKVPASHVFEVDDKTTVKVCNGHLQKVETGSGKLLQDLGALTTEELNAVNPYTYAARFNKTSNTGSAGAANAARVAGSNYPGYTAQADAHNIQSFSTKWVVPPVPQESFSTATTFLWNGIDRGTLQPVLMWGATAGGAFYAIANWYFLAGNYFHGAYVQVAPGTPLEGVITYISNNDTSWVYKLSFTGYPIADVTVTRSSEANDVIECWEAYTNILTQWPRIPYVSMTDIRLTTRSGTPHATFDWRVTGDPIVTPSGYNTVIVNDSTSNGEIRFYFDNEHATDSIVSGVNYKIVSALNNRSVLDVERIEITDGTHVILFDPHTPPAGNQTWKVTSIGNGYYKLQPQHAPTKVLDVTGASAADGTQVEIWSDIGSTAQQWRIVSLGDGYFRLTPACAISSALDVEGGSTLNVTKIQILATNNSAGQKFRFVQQ